MGRWKEGWIDGLVDGWVDGVSGRVNGLKLPFGLRAPSLGPVLLGR